MHALTSQVRLLFRFIPEGSCDPSWVISAFDLDVSELLRIQSLPDKQFAVISPREKRVVGATDVAWRWIGWIASDPKTGELTRFPAEVFGPLPPLRMPNS
jgi:hypothetical protein